MNGFVVNESYQANFHESRSSLNLCISATRHSYVMADVQPATCREMLCCLHNTLWSTIHSLFVNHVFHLDHGTLGSACFFLRKDCMALYQLQDKGSIIMTGRS